MEIKRVIAGGLTALAAGASLAFAAGAVTLGDFVQVTGNTMTSPYIVIGGNAAAEDTLAAADVGVALAGQATKPATIAGVSGVSATGGVMVTSDLNKTYLDESLSKAKASVTNTDMPETLKTLSFTDLNATTITYSQRIDLGAVAATFGKPTGEVVPVLFVPLTTSSNPFNLTVNFIGGLDSSAVDTSYKITLFGKTFTFGPTHDNNTLELYSTTGASTLTLSGVGSEETVSVGGTEFTFKIVGWGSETATNQGIYLQVNGQSTSPAEWREGSTYTLPGSTTKVYVNDVSVVSMGAQEKTVSAQLFVGTDKLKLENGQAITKNEQSTNTMVFFDSTVEPKINALTFQIYPQEDAVLADGADYADPIFSAITMALKDMTPGITSANRDLIKLTSSSTQVKLTFTNKDGNTYSEIPVTYFNSSGSWRMKDATYRVYTQECDAAKLSRQIKKGDYFVITSGDYSYMLKYGNYYIDSSTPSKSYVTLDDLSTGSQYKVYVGTSDKYIRLGSLSFYVDWGTGGQSAKLICVNLNGDGTALANATVNIKTQSGQVITVPQAIGHHLNITETPLYTVDGSNDKPGGSIDVLASYTASGGVAYTVSDAVSLEQLGSEYEWKDITSYGTYAQATGDTNGKKTVSFYVPGQRPAYVNIAVGESPVISTTATAGGTIQEAVQIKNSISKMESEIVTTALDRDLVLIGGPCANALVAELLNMSASKPDCSSEFTALYPTEGVIKVVEDAFDSGQKALIVAGVDRSATRDLAVQVMQGTVAYSA
jgi:hypothetical protein